MDEKNVNQSSQPTQPVTPSDPVQPAAEPTQPIAQPVAQPTQPEAQPASAPVVEPAQPVAQPVGEPTAQPVAQPTQPVNPYAAAQPTAPVGAPEGNPYQQSYAAGPAPEQPTQPANPYAASAPVAPPDGVPPYGQPPMYGQPQPTGNGKAVAALICGIAAILLCWLPLLSVILGIVAIVLAGSYIKAGGVAGTAKAGRICGIIGIVLAVLMFIASMLFGMAVYNQVMDEVNSSSPTSSSSAPAPSLSTPPASRAYPEDGLITDEERAACDVVGAEMERLSSADPAVVSAVAELIGKGFHEASDLTLAECGVDPNEAARLMLQDFEYQATMVVAGNDGTGFVAYDVKVRDVFDVLSDFADKINDLSNSPEAKTMTEDQAKARIGEAFIESIKGADMETEGYFSVDVTKTGGTWSIVQSSWDEEIDYFFGVY